MSGRRVTFLVLLAACTSLALILSARLTWTADISITRTHTLSEDARLALDALDGSVELVAFLPDLAVQRSELERLATPYLAHDQRARLTFVDPVADPERARAAGVTRHGELHLVSGPRREILLRPGRRAIDMALNRLALRTQQWIVVLQGYGERGLDAHPDGLLRLAEHLAPLGYRVVALDPHQVTRLPQNTAVLVAAGPLQPYPDDIHREIESLLDRGGGVLWLVQSDPAVLPSVEGLEAWPGTVVDAAAARYGLQHPEQAVVSALPEALGGNGPRGFAVLPTATALAWTPPDPQLWQRVASLATGPTSWNETGAIRGEVARDPEQGERPGPLSVGLLLQRSDGDGRLVVIGDADFIGNDQIGLGDNLDLATALLRWLGHSEDLGTPEPAPDLDIRWSPQLAAIVAAATILGLPLGYIAIGSYRRYRRRRA